MGRCVEARQDLERLHEIEPTHAQLKTFEEVTRCAQHVNNAHEYDRLNDKGSMVRELRMALELTDGSAAELMMWCVLLYSRLEYTTTPLPHYYRTALPARTF